MGFVVQGQPPSILLLPELIPDNADMARAFGLIVTVVEKAPNSRPCPPHVKVIATDDFSRKPLGLFTVGEIDVGYIQRQHILKP